jgi:hypothetical protein
MVQPAGPRISSMIWLTHSPGNALINRRSVEPMEPTRPPEPLKLSANSTNRRSMVLALTVPSDDIAWDRFRISSSSIFSKSGAECRLPTANMKIAAFSGPLRFRKSSLTRAMRENASQWRQQILDRAD